MAYVRDNMKITDSKYMIILLGFILLLLTVWLSLTSSNTVKPILYRLNNMAYDVQLRTRLLTQSHPIITSPVVIIDIDERSIHDQGRWPWPRSKLAELINDLSNLGAVVVALDMTFPEPETNIVSTVSQALQSKHLTNPQLDKNLQAIIPDFDNDIQFSKSLHQGETVMGMTFLFDREQIGGILPKPLFTLTTANEKQLNFITARGFMTDIPLLQQSAEGIGFLNAFPDDDGTIRHNPLLVRYGNNLYPSLALEATRLFLLLDKISLVTAPYDNKETLEGIQLGKQIIPTDDKSRVIIPFRGRKMTFKYYSATDVLNKKIAPHTLDGKLVFVGTSAIGLGDLQSTAIQNAFPGVEVHATIADGILTNNFAYTPPWASGAQLAITVLLGILLIFIFPFFGPGMLSLLTIIIISGLIFANNLLWEKTGLILSMLIPILFTGAFAIVNMTYGFLFESRRREQLKNIFGQYVPTQHIDEMLKTNESYGMLGEDREMTVLFADIRHFTAIAESMKVTEVKELLNQFFTPMTQIIFDHQGTVDKYVGDMIVAFWGAPLLDEKQKAHALQAAIVMQESTVKLKEEFAKRGWPEVNIGIGINSGIMSVGDMGSKFRRSYTVLGDAVNLGSRLEGLTKYYGVGIIASQYTYVGQEDIVFRQLDRVRVKGKRSGLDIFEVVGLRKSLDNERLKEIELSEQALEFYFAQEWNKADELFTRLHHNHPEVVLYSLYLERIKGFRQNPPDKEWGGVYVHLEK